MRALWHDLDEAPSRLPRLTVAVMSEFGRRFVQNSDDGCDHGHGNNVLVMSGHATGGLHGAWPGVHPDQLNDGDLEVTTDFRRVLSEILIRRLGNPRIDLVFPGYTGYSPLGVVTGQDLPIGAEVLFADDFEIRRRRSLGRSDRLTLPPLAVSTSARSPLWSRALWRCADLHSRRGSRRLGCRNR